MRIRVNAPMPSPISFGTVKEILRSVGLTPELAEGRLAQAVRLYYPLDRQLAERVRAEAISLTDGAIASEQIRYFQTRRVRRNHVMVTEHISSVSGSVDLEIGSCDSIDAPSREFLSIASRIAGWNVTYSSASIPAAEEAVHHGEGCLKEALRDESMADELAEAAWEFINVGDAWTGTALGRRLLARERSARVWSLLAIGHAMLRETEKAEFYYDEWARRGDSMDKVRALYGKSMLYARHHPDGLRDTDMAAACLDHAYGIIGNLSELERAHDDVVFEEVFNRNGFALVLFRRGHVDEALDLLKDGITRLSATTERVAIHRSVLIYNLAQCHKQLGDIEAAIRTFDQLLDVDPYMAEYHLEAAKCLSAAGDHARSVEECEIAVALDDTLAISWRMLGLAHLSCGRLDAAVHAYSRAVGLEPENTTGRADAAYAFIRAHRCEDALAVLEPVEIESLSPAEIDRHFSLSAEAHLRRDRVQNAVEQLTIGMRMNSSSQVLALNLEKVAARR
ncbi:tetratricopeptide repeat protein [Leifsonia sp. C5G2]|uniref:tetratricopeptide repeat protein n=1 Tax=Leifsonia sp. C5G2 TaxID=2735269 RepID=UPI001584E8D6|nr:tetratricopeptide repeat protein [Leifsonia sp. C5G2]NUU08531.1 tetratricopeptide repeat protein [Leifsonia sp. C5G2]